MTLLKTLFLLLILNLNASYTPYGELSSHIGSSENSFLYTGEQFDKESGNYYLRARYYDTISSRFISRDTYDGSMSDPISLNHYAYAGANPTMYVDPSGHFFGGFVSFSLSSLSTVASGYPRIAGTVEQGAVVSLNARTLVLDMEMRNEALNSIVFSIMYGNMSKQNIDDAYKKYSYATQYIGMVTATAYDVYSAFTYTQATISFAKGLTQLPIATYSSVPSKYVTKVNGLNRYVDIGLEKVVKDPIQFEKAMEILKDMSKLMVKLSQEALK